eukprot:01839_6
MFHLHQAFKVFTRCRRSRWTAPLSNLINLPTPASMCHLRQAFKVVCRLRCLCKPRYSTRRQRTHSRPFRFLQHRSSGSRSSIILGSMSRRHLSISQYRLLHSICLPCPFRLLYSTILLPKVCMQPLRMPQHTGDSRIRNLQTDSPAAAWILYPANDANGCSSSPGHAVWCT